MLSIAIQHHPSRAELIPALLSLLAPEGDAPGIEVVTDPDPDGPPSALRTYLECLARTPATCTHRLVLQDDAWPVHNFPARALEAICEHPDALIAFSVQNTGTPGRLVRHALKRGDPWAYLPARTLGWVPTIALAWPVAFAESFLAFARRTYRSDLMSDDAPVATWAKKHNVQVWATVPSLVEHPDVVPSLIPGRRAKAGKNRARVAVVWADD